MVDKRESSPQRCIEHKGKNINPDPNDREYNEIWPGGRTNHYWFDMNRDWLPVQLPESQARVKTFHDWYPNILTDHHEMGTNSTFFFQPGIPSRTNPLTPNKNQELNQGDRIGMIRFGSRADVYYENYEPLVKVGQKAISGETLLAKK